MTHTPLTKAERANVLLVSSLDGHYASGIKRLCADLDAAEAERDRAVSERSEAIIQMQREWTALTDQFDGLRAQRDRAESERATLKAKLYESQEKHGGCILDLNAVKAKLAACEAERDAQATELVDERDRAKAKLAAAESDLDAERKMRVEAEAASDRLMEERDASRFHLAALASAASSIDPSDHCYVADIEAFRAAIASSQAYSNGDEIDKIAGSELRAVMESVDKWLSGDDLTANPATRAARAREVALKAIDAAEAERDEAVAEHTQRAVDQQNATAHGASWWPEKAIELRARAEKAEAQRDRAESERDALKDELHAHLAARNALRAEEGAES